MAFGDIKIVREFSAEQAGQVVGWSSVQEVSREDRDPYFVAKLVGATVGPHGARLGQYEYERDGEIHAAYSQECAEGFVAVSGLSVLLFPGRSIMIGGGNFQYAEEPMNHHESGAATLLSGVRISAEGSPRDEEKSWGSSPAEVLGGLKHYLSDCGMPEHYHDIYYLYNGHAGHEFFHKLFTKNQTFHDTTSRPLLADPGKHDETVKQIDAAQTVRKSLGDILELDQKMQRNLTTFSGLSAHDIPDIFRESRRLVAAKERLAAEDSAALTVSGLVLLPIGFRPSGRSWPYMDASEVDESKAFGRELAGLEAGDVSMATSELDREMRELEHRIKYASQGIGSLTLLAAAETQAA